MGKAKNYKSDLGPRTILMEFDRPLGLRQLPSRLFFFWNTNKAVHYLNENMKPDATLEMRRDAGKNSSQFFVAAFVEAKFEVVWEA